MALVLAASATLGLLRADQPREELPSLATMPAFRLTDQEGRSLAAADVRGRVLLVGFIYTTCDDICPVVTAHMRSLQEDLARAGLLGEAELLSISVDPERDTRERLANYARQFQADTASWRFLTGEPEHVRKVVVEGFLLGVQKVPANSGADHAHGSTPAQAGPDYRVEHSGRIALVDRSGQIRAYYEALSLDRNQVVAQVRLLVKGR